MEIARETVRLFTSKGVAATSADEIAEAVGISTRTLRRYFPSKEACVQPLLAAGAEAVTRRLRTWPSGRTLREAVNDWEDGDALMDEPDVAASLELIRLTRTEPGLKAVWLQTYHEYDGQLAEILAERAGCDADDLHIRIQAATINAALRVAAEHYAWRERVGRSEPGQNESAGLSEALRTAVLTAAQGLPD
ncbi:TetR family transcriptional regulator [Streptomyces sp. NPDC006476]|uniref:TetR/AcrR family transcriptional regulator n=1 Tax=Streptomyces sp. NPDC006476 TaxID=3157175 RepID=UPI0033B44E90